MVISPVGVGSVDVVFGFSRNDLIGLELLGALMKMGRPYQQVRFNDLQFSSLSWCALLLAL